MLGHAEAEVVVAHLVGGPAAAPLLLHQPELDARLPQYERDGARNGLPVEGGLAVAEENRLASDGQVQTLRPVADLALRRLDVPAEHGFVSPAVGQVVPALPLGLVDIALDRQRAHRLDEVDRPCPVAVEVACEERVGAPQLAGPAHRAVHVVARHVLDLEMPFLHRDDVCVERSRRMGLVARDLRDRANLAAELVPGAETAVGGVTPLRHELAREPAVTGRLADVLRCHRSPSRALTRLYCDRNRGESWVALARRNRSSASP